MKEWFQRLKVSQKLMLISIFFVMPDSVMLYLFITGINANIHFARLEQKGNEYQRPLEDLLELIPRASRCWRSALADGERVAAEQMARKGSGRSTRPLTTWRRSNRAHRRRTSNSPTKAWPSATASTYRPHIVAAEWEELKAAADRRSIEPALAARHLHLIADVRTMITHAGDISNLILDPDLDSYYLMDATLLALPQTQDRLAAVMAHGEAVLKQAVISAAERQQFADLRHAAARKPISTASRAACKPR